jgi:tRNA A37 threonylcarbamoyladenosine dehydratase
MQKAVDPAPILELINAFRRSKILFTFVSSGIVDILHRHGSLSAGEVQKHLQTTSPKAQIINPIKKELTSYESSETVNNSNSFSVDAIDRLLRASVSLGLVNITWPTGATRTQPPQFSLTELSTEYLSPTSKTPLSGKLLTIQSTF